MEKDYSLLRPFDLEAAKRGEQIVTIRGDDSWEYVAGPDAEGNLCLRVKSSGCFTLPSASPASFFCMAPLAWVRVSDDDPTLRPVYKGDVLWYTATGTCQATVEGPHPHTEDGISYIDGNDGTAQYSHSSSFTWTPPKVKREIKMLATITLDGFLRWVEAGSYAHDNAVSGKLRFVPSEDKVIVIEE